MKTQEENEQHAMMSSKKSFKIRNGKRCSTFPENKPGCIFGLQEMSKVKIDSILALFCLLTFLS